MIDNTDARTASGERRYERWQAANARADVRRGQYEKVALVLMGAAISAWIVVHVLL